ncbi:MAG: hypothetical protein WA096_12795 [Smithella sp.]
MKKILLLTVIALFVMMPLASFAKTAISDSELGAVTAQTGVTIAFTDFSVSLNGTSLTAYPTISWGDSNGFGIYNAPGYVGAQISELSANAVKISGAMTIDVGTNAGVTAIGITLPTISLAGNLEMAVKLAGDRAFTGANNGTLGTAFISGLSVVPSGSLAIYAH